MCRSTAAKHLKNHAWNVQQAANAYFNVSLPHTTPAASKNTLSRLFDKYEKKDADTINVNGTMTYFGDLGINPEQYTAFVVSEILKCPTLGEIQRDSFTAAWSELGGDTIDKQKKIIAMRCASLSSDVNARKAVYTYAFKLGLTESNQRTIEKDVALQMWNVLLAPPMSSWKTKSHDWLNEWTEFVTQANTKGVNKDVWEQTFKFAQETLKDETLSWWNENSAWPALIDEFVEWIKAKSGGGAGGEDEDMEY